MSQPVQDEIFDSLEAFDLFGNSTDLAFHDFIVPLKVIHGNV